jgi:hypothetical protein
MSSGDKSVRVPIWTVETSYTPNGQPYTEEEFVPYANPFKYVHTTSVAATKDVLRRLKDVPRFCSLHLTINVESLLVVREDGSPVAEDSLM